MPAQIVVVHDDPDFLHDCADALTASGREVAVFLDPMAALAELESPRSLRLLITRVIFAPGKPNGVALARMAKYKKPDVSVLFVALPETREYAEQYGEFLEYPLPVSHVIEAANRILSAPR